jgi:DNA uptake protein ComE-like DNA-binding protein
MTRTILFIAVAVSVATVGLEAQEDWIKLEHCHLVPDPANDGDSFHVRANEKEYIFRLYLVDAPETEATDPARLIEQAKYFGISVPQVIELGEAAKLFVQEKLAEPFTVITRMANAMGRSKRERFYAFVQTKDGDLGEELVANGLARVHGRSAKPPGITSSATESQKLKNLENQAKQTKLGGWAANIERSNTLTTSPAPPAASSPSTSKYERLFAAKFDVNTATEKELRLIPGIGPVMARRIIDARPFKSADDLRKVNGIGDKKYDQIRPYFN